MAESGSGNGSGSGDSQESRFSDDGNIGVQDRNCDEAKGGGAAAAAAAPVPHSSPSSLASLVGRKNKRRKRRSPMNGGGAPGSTPRSSLATGEMESEGGADVDADGDDATDLGPPPAGRIRSKSGLDPRRRKFIGSDEEVGTPGHRCRSAALSVCGGGGGERHRRPRNHPEVGISLPVGLEGELDNVQTPTSASSGDRGTEREGFGRRDNCWGKECGSGDDDDGGSHDSPGRRRRRRRPGHDLDNAEASGDRAIAAGEDSRSEFEYGRGGGEGEGEGNVVRRPESRRGVPSSTAGAKPAAAVGARRRRVTAPGGRTVRPTPTPPRARPLISRQQRALDEEPLIQAQAMQGDVHCAPVPSRVQARAWTPSRGRGHSILPKKNKKPFSLGASPKLNEDAATGRAGDGGRERERVRGWQSEASTLTFPRKASSRNGDTGWLESRRCDGDARLSPPSSSWRRQQQQKKQWRTSLCDSTEEANGRARAEDRDRDLDLGTMDCNARRFNGGSTQSARAARKGKGKGKGKGKSEGRRGAPVVGDTATTSAVINLEGAKVEAEADARRRTAGFSPPEFDGDSEQTPTDAHSLLDCVDENDINDANDNDSGNNKDDRDAGLSLSPKGPPVVLDLMSDDEGEDAAEDDKPGKCRIRDTGDGSGSNVNSNEGNDEVDDREPKRSLEETTHNSDSNSDSNERSDYGNLEYGSGSDGDNDEEFESEELESTERPCARTRAKEEARRTKGKDDRGWSGRASASAAEAVAAAAAATEAISDKNGPRLVDVDLYGSAKRDDDDDHDRVRPLPVEDAFSDGDYGNRGVRVSAMATGAVSAAAHKRSNPMTSRKGNPINTPGSSLLSWQGRRFTDLDDDIESFHGSPSLQSKKPKKKKKKKTRNSDVRPEVWEELRKDNLKRTPDGDLKGSFSGGTPVNGNGNGNGNNNNIGNKRRKREGGQKSVFEYLGNEKGPSQQSRTRSNGISPSAFHSKGGGGRDQEHGDRRKQGRDHDWDSGDNSAAAWQFFGEQNQKAKTRLAGKRKQGAATDRRKDEIILIDDSDDSDDDDDNDDSDNDNHNDEGRSGAGTLSSDQHELNKQMSEEEQYQKALRKSRFDQTGRHSHPSRRRKSPRLRVTGDRYKCEAVRIAVGKKVFSSMCMLQFQPGAGGPFLQVEFTPRGDSSKNAIRSRAASRGIQRMKINVEDIVEMKYFVSSESPSDGDGDGDYDNSNLTGTGSGSDMSFLSMRVQPTEENGLTQYSSAYMQNSEDKGEDEDGAGKGHMNRSGNGNGQARSTERRYLVVEARHDDELTEILEKMRENSILQAFLTEDAQLRAGAGAEISRYAATLIEDSRKEEERRLQSLAFSPSVSRKSARLRHGDSASTSASASDKGSSDGRSKTYLVFPFASAEDSERIYTQAARGLREASGALVSFENDYDGGGGLEDEDEDGDGDGNRRRVLAWRPSQHPNEGKKDAKAGSLEKGGSAKVRGAGRTHHLTIRSEDVDRLEPGEFLNDTLIDFWMRWIWRHDNPITSPVYFFTSHFFTTLLEEGPEAVSSWTSKKGIDIFEKDFIFIPINESLHWSLCVVVNPGFIVNALQGSQDSDDSGSVNREDARCPCILFLDSLKAHRKAKVAARVRKWLNSEARRLSKFGEARTGTPFNTSSMRVYDPRIPYQDNSWDCGVFVCRYAYALLLISRRTTITYGDVGRERHSFEVAITLSPEFTFGMPDIARLREEMKTLIANLSEEYQKMKEKEAKDKRARKAQKKKNWCNKEKSGSGFIA